MKSRFLFLIAIALLSPMLVFGVTCANPTVVPADGRVVDFDFVLNGTSNYYQFDATAGHSYSVEVRQDYDDINTDVAATLADPTGRACPGYTALAGTNATATTYEPILAANATRLSFTAGTTGTHGVQVANTGTAGHYISVSVAETTAYNPNWSTFGTFITQYNFLNTTSATITGTLTVTPTVGSSLTPRVVAVSIPPHGQLGKVAGPGGDANIPVNSAGFAIFTHNGPAGSVQTQAQFLNGSATVIVPTKFEAVRQSH